MRPPRFWSRPRGHAGAWPVVLAPLAALWTAVTRARLRRPGERVGVPVICVGNLTVGGTGKTPTVIALAERLIARGLAPHVVTRGYRGSLPGPVRVDERRHTAAEVGDEPLLIAPFAPVWVARDRLAAARAAVVAGAEVVLMDDGLQNPGLAKDLSIVVVDAGCGFGNGRVMPAGPLREPVADGLARADLVLAIGSAEECARLLAEWPELAARRCVKGRLEPLLTGMRWLGLRALAFAGIGRPEKFFATLRGLGAEVLAAHAFPDHAAYPPMLLSRLTAEAKARRAQLVTTEKDAVRLPPAMRRQVLALPVRLQLDDWSPVDRALERLVGAR
jgi:tetraacyldisaccharide 4'-kinase